MKKLFSLLVICATAFTARAQSHDISINLAPIAVGSFSANYMLNFSDEMSAGGVLGYQSFKIGDFKYSGYYIAPEFRFYFNPDENDGFYAGGYLKWRDYKSTGLSGFDGNGNIVEYDQINRGLALGVVGGRLWTTNSGVFFGVWSGFGYYLMDNTTYTNDYDPDAFFGSVETTLPSIDYRLGISIGYRIGGY